MINRSVAKLIGILKYGILPLLIIGIFFLNGCVQNRMPENNSDSSIFEEKNNSQNPTMFVGALNV